MLSAAAVYAQVPFAPIYWVKGVVNDAPGQPADGRKIFFDNGKAWDTIGPQGKSGASNHFLINAGDAGAPLDAGKKYQVFTEKINDFGVGPVELELSGNGIDDLGTLNLIAGGGKSGIKAMSVQLEPAPAIKVYFGSRVYQKDLVDKGSDFIISKKPKVKMEVAIDPPYSLDQKASGYSLLIDGVSYSFTGTKIEKNKAALEITLNNALASGSHTFKLSAASAGDQAAAAVGEEIAKVQVSAGPLRILDTPLCFPNPFNPEKDGSVAFQYTLSDDAKIDIFIFNIAGEVVKKIVLNEGEEGAIGQLNKVKWDGMTDQGTIASNGIYIINIVSRDENRILGKFKLSVYR